MVDAGVFSMYFTYLNSVPCPWCWINTRFALQRCLFCDAFSFKSHVEFLYFVENNQEITKYCGLNLSVWINKLKVNKVNFLLIYSVNIIVVVLFVNIPSDVHLNLTWMINRDISRLQALQGNKFWHTKSVQNDDFNHNCVFLKNMDIKRLKCQWLSHQKN